MSGNEKDGRSDLEQEFDTFLREDDSRIGRLYRKLPQPEPDAQLDARVRSLAQRALRSDAAVAIPAKTSLRRPARWLPALSAAAALVLAAGIAWRVAPQVWPAKDQVVATSSLDAGVAAQNRAAVKGSVEQSSPTDAPGASRAQDTAAPAQNAQAPVAPRAPQSAGAPEPRARDKARRAEKPESAPSAFPAGAAPATPSPPAAPAPAVAEVAAPTRESQYSSAAAAKLVTGQARDTEKAEHADAASTPAAAQAAAATRAPRVDEREQKQLADQLEAAPAPMLRKSAPSTATPTNWSDQKTSGITSHGAYPPDIPPTQDLRIFVVRQLLQQDRRDDARRALADFRARYPQDQWPPDLRDLK
jgi:hypothetical protein